MTYRVLWSPRADARLEQILRGSDAVYLATLTRRIDQFLVASPRAFGESRDEDVRVGYILPLGVLYEVMDDVRTVVVYDLWRVDRK